MKVCVFCGSSTQVAQKYFDLGHEVGKILAKNNIDLVYGAGSVGIMGIMADAALEHGGKVFGVIPEFMIPWEVCHQGLTDLKITETMHERKQLMYEEADAFIALPGGMGTLDELCEILTWKQLGSHEKPVWIVNFDGFYDGLIEHFKKLLQEAFVGEDHFSYIQIADSVEEIICLLNKKGEGDELV